MVRNCYILENNVRHYDFKKCLQHIDEEGKKRYGQKFTIDKSDHKIIYQLLCFAIREEEQCANFGIDLNKGILLIGPVGCGKTSLLTLINDFMFKDQKYQVKSTLEIASEFNNEGFTIIHKYGFRQKVFCLDDIGVEQNMKYYGNECNTIAEILLLRYDLFVNFGIVTHATTNLNAEELEKLYGARVRSRLRSMFNLISFPKTSNDKRK